MIIYDIETIPQDGLVAPEFEAPANYKDPAKIADAIAQKKQSWLDDAALHAERGQIALIGCKTNDEIPVVASLDEISEQEILESFWTAIKIRSNEYPFVGFNSNSFDIPFLVRRSIILGIPYPRNLIFDKRGYINDAVFVDLLNIWRCGDKSEYISLDNLSKLLGGKSKTTTGAEFPNLWKTDKQKAIQHLTDDLELTAFCAGKMLNYKE